MSAFMFLFKAVLEGKASFNADEKNMKIHPSGYFSV